MNKRKLTMPQPLDIVLSAPSHISILRVLKDVKEGLSGREVARRAGLNHQTVAESLGRLETKGIVRRLGSGRSQLFRLNRDNVLVNKVLLPMLAGEQKQFIRMQEELFGVVAGHCLSAVIFGSVARGEETPGSDLDIMLIVERKTVSIQEITRKLVQTGMKSWGIRVSPIMLTRAELIQRAKRNDELVYSVINEGIVLWGPNPRALLR